MVIPYFGWSAGDIAQAVKVLMKIREAFSRTYGASAKFAETASFLQGLEATLRLLQEYTDNNKESQYSKDIQEQLLRIQRPLASFATYLSKYDAALGEHPTASRAKQTANKVQWAFHELSEVAGKTAELKKAVIEPLTVINTLLTLQSCEGVRSLAKSASGYPLCVDYDAIVRTMNEADIPTQLKLQIYKLHQVAQEQKQILSEENRQTRDTVINISEGVIRAQSQETLELIAAMESQGQNLQDTLTTIVAAIGRDNSAVEKPTSLKDQLEEVSRSLKAIRICTENSSQELNSRTEQSRNEAEQTTTEDERRSGKLVNYIVVEFIRSLMTSIMTVMTWIFLRPYATRETERSSNSNENVLLGPGPYTSKESSSDVRTDTTHLSNTIPAPPPSTREPEISHEVTHNSQWQDQLGNRHRETHLLQEAGRAALQSDAPDSNGIRFPRLRTLLAGPRSTETTPTPVQTRSVPLETAEGKLSPSTDETCSPNPANGTVTVEEDATLSQDLSTTTTDGVDAVVVAMTVLSVLSSSWRESESSDNTQEASWEDPIETAVTSGSICYGYDPDISRHCFYSSVNTISAAGASA